MQGLADNIESGLTQIFHRCVEDCHEAIMVTDREGCLRYINQAWTRIYGYSRDEVLGRNPRILRSGMQDQSFYKRMWQSILDEKVGHWKGEVVNRTKAGEFVHVILTITPMRNPSGEISAYMGIALDVTELKKMETMLKHHDRLQSLGLMASGLAHEISNPVAIMRGRAEMLLRKKQGDADIERVAAVIIKQADRIGDLVKKLSRFSRAGDKLQCNPIRVRVLVEDIIHLTLELFKSKEIKVGIHIPHDIMVEADENYLQQIFVNLFINAVHAIHEAIKAGKTSGHSINIDCKRVQQGGEVFCAIRVTDSGCGIPPENLDKVFELFFTTKSAGKGTGLGLAIVTELLTEMGGFITVDQGVKTGASFIIYLPAYCEQEEDVHGD